MKGRGIQINDFSSETGEIFDLRIEPERDESDKIIRGLVVGQTLEQNKALILMSNQGELKMQPQIGVGIEGALLSNDFLEYRHRIRRHFAMDGLKVTKLDLYMNKPFKIDANY